MATNKKDGSTMIALPRIIGTVRLDPDKRGAVI